MDRKHARPSERQLQKQLRPDYVPPLHTFSTRKPDYIDSERRQWYLAQTQQFVAPHQRAWYCWAKDRSQPQPDETIMLQSYKTPDDHPIVRIEWTNFERRRPVGFVVTATQ